MSSSLSETLAEFTTIILKLQKLETLCQSSSLMVDFLTQTLMVQEDHERYYWRHKFESHSYKDRGGTTRLNIYTLMCSLDLHFQQLVCGHVAVSTRECGKFMDYMSSIYTFLSPFEMIRRARDLLNSDEHQQVVAAWVSSVPANHNYMLRDHTAFFMSLTLHCQEVVLLRFCLN